MEFTLRRTSGYDGNARIEFSGTISAADLMELKLDAMQRALMDDISGNGGDAADYLLVLEGLFRAARQQGLQVTGVVRT